MPPHMNLAPAPQDPPGKPAPDDGVDPANYAADPAAYSALDLAPGASLREVEDRARLLLRAFDPDGVPAALRAATAERAREISRARDQLVRHWHAHRTPPSIEAAAPIAPSVASEPSAALRAAIASHPPTKPAARRQAEAPRRPLAVVGGMLLKAALVGLVLAAAIQLQHYRAGHPFFNPFAEPRAAVALGMPVAPAARWTGLEVTDRQSTSPVPSRQRPN
ncbi:MAG: hypothetical protein ACM3JG_20280 [Thiohalocapsa sp.]